MQRGTARSCAGAASAQAISQPIDHKHLARYTLGDRALEREVLQLFCSQTLLCLEGLRNARSLAQWSEAAHSLKGSAKAVGAARVAEAAARAETLTALEPGKARESRLMEIEAAIAEAKAYIQSLP